MSRNGHTRQDSVELPSLSPWETPWAQGTTETEENSSSSRQRCFDQNIDSSRQDDVLIAVTSSQGKSVNKEKISIQSTESQNESKSRQQYSDLPALSPGKSPWAQDSLSNEKYLQGSVRQVAPSDGVVLYQAGKIR